MAIPVPHERPYQAIGIDPSGNQVGTVDTPVRTNASTNDMGNDAWGVPKFSLEKSLFHGMWTFDIPEHIWLTYENGVEIKTSLATSITSVSGHAKLLTTATEATAKMESRECPRYQPNRGHRIATAGWMPNPTNDCIREWGGQTTENGVFFRLRSDGRIYAVLKSGGVERFEEVIDTSVLGDFDVTNQVGNGNVYDIIYQWRGVGNYWFFINLRLVHTFLLLGKYAQISMENPALPFCARAIRGTQEAEMHIGCADISSENGTDDKEVFSAMYSEGVTTGVDKPILVMSNPLQINGTTNTRTVSLARVSVKATKKQTIKVWTTRDPTAIVGATYKVIGDGSFVECDSIDMDATAVRATSVVKANLHYLTSIPIEANVENSKDNPDPKRITFHIVRGDYVVITSGVAASTAECVIEIGEEI